MGVVLLKPEVKTQWTVLLGYLTSYFLRNISAKNHQNQFTYVKVIVSQRCELFMVALWNRADHYIFMLWFVLSSFFSHLISPAAIWMSAILPHMVWP